MLETNQKCILVTQHINCNFKYMYDNTSLGQRSSLSFAILKIIFSTYGFRFVFHFLVHLPFPLLCLPQLLSVPLLSQPLSSPCLPLFFLHTHKCMFLHVHTHECTCTVLQSNPLIKLTWPVDTPHIACTNTIII